MALYAQTSGNHSTNSGTMVPIPGLSLTLPEGVGEIAIVTLNVPNPYAQGNNYPGGNFAIGVNGKPQAPFASFTYGIQNPPSTNRMPTTLVVGVALANQPQNITGMWSGVRGSTVLLDSPATLSVVL